MSGYLSTFLDSCYSFPSNPCHNPSKPFRILTPIHLPHNPLPTRRIIRRSRTRRRNSLQLSVLPQDFDLIETSEHHDGSLIFRFGDPSKIAKSDASVENSESKGEEGSDAVKVVVGDHEEVVIVETIVGEERSDCAISSSTDVFASISKLDNDITVVERESDVKKDLSGSQVESSQRDDLVEDLESEREEGNIVLKVPDEDQVIAKTVERRERSDAGSSSSIDVSDSISKVDTDITANTMESYLEKDTSDSQVESSERSLEIFQEGKVSLPVPVSVSDFQMDDLLSSDLGLTNADKGKYSDEKYEDTVSSSVTITVADDSFNLKRIDDSEEEVTMFESPSFKLDLTTEDPNIEVMQLSLDGEDQKVEAGLETELAVNEADKNITVVETETDVVGDLSDSQPELSERTLEISHEVKVSDSGLQTETADNINIAEADITLVEAGLQTELAVNEADKNITVVETETDVVGDLSDSQPELSERTLEISHEVKVSDSGLQTETADNINIAEAEITLVETKSNVVGDLNDSQSELSGRPLEISPEVEVPVSGLQIEVANSINKAEKEITVIKTESDVVGNLSVSQPELSERTLEISHEVQVSDSWLQTEATNNIIIAETDSALVETESNVVGDLNNSQLELGERPLEISLEVEVPVSGLQTEVANSINKAEKDITVIETESGVVGDLCNSQPGPSERLLEISQEVEVPVSVSDITTNDHFHTLNSSEDAVDDEDGLNEKIDDVNSMSITVTDNSLCIEDSGDTEEVTTVESSDITVVQSPSVELNDLVLQDPSIEVVSLLVDAKDQNIVAESQHVNTEDSGEIHSEVVTPLSQGLQAELVLDDGVSHDALEESAEADSIFSPTMLKQEVANSLVEAERTKGENQSSEFSEVSSIKAIQLELTETDVKREENSIAAFFLSSGAAVLAHPSKALTGGEDAYFLACSNWLGIADGIGHWSLEGIDPGVYAQELMKNCEIIVSDNSTAAMVNPLEVLSRSVEETQSSGSSTVLVAYFDGQALHVANIGDTGFMIIRHGAVYKKSSPMLHELNFSLHIERGDNPLELAEEYRIDLDEGDTIIAATDGLFDNLYEQEIASVVSKSLQGTMKPEEIAKVLAKRAQEAGGSACGRSPFADAVQAAGYTGYTGGKLDDVAVIVCFVENRSNSHIQ